MKLIAEVSSNFQNLSDCLTSIKLAKKAGAWAVKFQLFSPQDLYGPSCKAIYQPGVSPFLEPTWLDLLKAESVSQGIEFMCTAFNPAKYELVNRYVNYHKIASAELTDTNILKTVNSFKKHVFLSTGGSSIDEISHALLYLKDCPVTIMYCVADYPAKVVDFTLLLEMQDYFGTKVYTYGFSDHTTDLFNIPITAQNHDCAYVEKHVNLCGLKNTDDAAHSIGYHDLEFLVKALSGELTRYQIQEHSNKDMKALWKRRFIALQEIKKGDKFVIDKNIGIYRSMHKHQDPVLTFRPWDIQSKTCLIDKKPGEAICYGDYEIEID